MGFWQRLFGVQGKRPTAVTSLDHPSLGVLHWENEWWTGQRRMSNESVLKFSIAGDPDGPAENLVAALMRTLNQWPETWREIMAFLKKEDRWFPELEDFSPECISYLAKDMPGKFTVDLELNGDANGFWFVEFCDGKPKCVVRDD